MAAALQRRQRRLQSSAGDRRAILAPFLMAAGAVTFRTVSAIGRRLADVEETTTWGKPTLKVKGKMFVCIASHPSAEPNTLVVMMDFAQRDAMIEDDPATYYLKEHYLNYPCILVRLSRVHRDAVEDLVRGAYEFVVKSRRRRSTPNLAGPSPGRGPRRGKGGRTPG